MRLAVLAVPGLWLARGDSESCGELSVESLFGAIPQREDEWLRWVAARPNQPAAALRAAEVLRGPATEQSVQEAWREVETIQLDGCESAELVGWFRFRYFQWLPKTDLSALEQQLRQCSGSALEVAAGLLLSRDGTQTPEALKLLAEAGPSLRLALALHSSGEKSAVASLTPRAQQELKLSEEGRDFDELLLATFGFWLAGIAAREARTAGFVSVATARTEARQGILASAATARSKRARYVSLDKGGLRLLFAPTRRGCSEGEKAPNRRSWTVLTKGSAGALTRSEAASHCVCPESIPSFADLEAAWARVESRLDTAPRGSADASWAACVQKGAAPSKMSLGWNMDADVLAELHALGLEVGEGSSHGENNCLVDSMLQCLAAADVLPEEVLLCAETRQAMCAAARARLVAQADVRLRPQRLDACGVRDSGATAAEHECAYLQHHLHAEPVLRSIMADCGKVEWPDIELTVYAAGDAVHRCPDRVLLAGAGQPAEKLRLSLFSRTDADGNGWHYDPLFEGRVSAELDVAEEAAPTFEHKEAAGGEAGEDEAVVSLALMGVRRDSGDQRQALEEAVEHTVAGRMISMSEFAGRHRGRIVCAFRGCEYTCATADVLDAHLREVHAGDLAAAVAARSRLKGVSSEAHLAVYRLCLQELARRSPPQASASQDRACLRSYCDQVRTARTLMCFVCACRFAGVEEEADQDIQRYRAADMRGLLELLSFTTYMEKYGNLWPSGPDLRGNEAAFREWLRGFEGTLLLCCPEDVDCAAHDVRMGAGELCPACSIPICSVCVQDWRASRGSLPAAALSNDLWTGYLPVEIYTQAATVCELIAASPCLTGMFCFSLEYHRASSVYDATAYMPRHRLGARGNVTSYPLPWLDLLAQLGSMEAGNSVALPRTGVELAETVQVLLRTGGGLGEADAGRFLHQARVRRAVVLALIRGAVARKHTAYANVDLEAAMTRAAGLPEDGVPPEIVRLLDPDRNISRLRPQKAATPADGCHLEAEDAARQLADVRPHAVLLENSSALEEDAVAQDIAAWRHFDTQLRWGTEPPAAAVTITAGSQLVDQFKPLYFGVAFAFCFSYCIGLPDLVHHGTTTRYRREASAPIIDFPRWARAVSRRAESQFARDWLLLFALWNYSFRVQVNSSRGLVAYVPRGLPSLTSEELTEGAVALCKALHGQYRAGPDAPLQPVAGDVSKLHMVPELPRAARILLQNVQHVSAKIPGTVEVRKLMRHETHAYRIIYGEPIFVTISPNERDNLLSVRLFRCRKSDPVVEADEDARQWGGERQPVLGTAVTEATAGLLPAFEARRHLAAADPLSVVEAFHLQLRLCLRHLFGINICKNCPRCNCMSEDGSVASLRLGIFGRVTAVYAALEHQKAGGLHAHMQVFVENLHQVTPLHEIWNRLEKEASAPMVQRYLAFKAHVCKETYDDLATQQQRAHEVEAAWPEHARNPALVSMPTYLLDGDASDASWAEAFRADVQRIQELKQHHVHPFDGEGRRQLLRHCQSRQDRTVCKGRFPRVQEICSEAVVLCPGLARAFNLPFQGRRNLVGALVGPRNNEWVNGTHPALTAALRANTDVQLPYRLPPCKETHSSLCDEASCLDGVDLQSVITAAQHAQNAQCGYAGDYGSKRQVVALHEVNEWMRGQRALGEELAGKARSYQGARHLRRFLSDAYGRGIVRSAPEVVNLLTRQDSNVVTAAEALQTAPTESFPGRVFLECVEGPAQGGPAERPQRQYLQVDWRSRRHRSLTLRRMDILYGCRGTQWGVRDLSAYEWVRYWRVELARYRAPAEGVAKGQTVLHADLTASGHAKSEGLEAGVDYRVREGGGEDWVPFPDLPETERFRHQWVMVRRTRPVVPVFSGAPLPKVSSSERTCMLLMAYFHPWTLLEHCAAEGCPLASQLRGSAASWATAFANWQRRGASSVEQQRYVQNFLNVTRSRPGGSAVDSDEVESFSDEEVTLTQQELPVALETHVSGRAAAPGATSGAEKVSHWTNSTNAMARAQQVWGGETQRGRTERRGEQGGPEALRAAEQQLEAAKKSKRPAAWEAEGGGRACPRAGDVRVHPLPFQEDLEAWLGQQEGLAAEQHEFLRVVVEQLCKGLPRKQRVRGKQPIRGCPGEPLRWLLHGRPGVGKSFVLGKLRELFEMVMGWQAGVQFAFVALQVSNAAQHEGQTCHSFFGLNKFGQPVELGPGALQEKQRSFQRLEWVVVDEVSMLSASFLAVMERQARTLRPERGSSKLTSDNSERPWGGLSMVLAGDFHQLDPPDNGRSLCSIPDFERMQRPCAATAEFGQALIWDKGDGYGLHGVTEMQTPQRCRDAWWLDLLEQCRFGRLSEENHKFLHGLPTDVPGSFVNGQVLCGKRECAALCGTACLEQECTACQLERKRRRLVASGPTDGRFAGKFKDAPLIVANNDVKYEANKIRAQDYARQTDQAVVSWTVEGDESEAAVLSKPAAAVVVEFPDASWQVCPDLAVGQYPLGPQTVRWSVDTAAPGRKPVLWVRRSQIPLRPALALTAHGALGLTLEKAIVDLQLSAEMSSVGSYVALSRVRRAEDVLIFRPFARGLLARGPAPGPVVLLKWLSGEPVDWSVLDTTDGGTKECSRCGRKRPSASFAAPDGNAATSAASAAVCQVCRRGEKTCVACHVRKEKADFSAQRGAGRDICNLCWALKAECSLCLTWCPRQDFPTDNAAGRADTGRGRTKRQICKSCQAPDCWCVGCERKLGKGAFTHAQLARDAGARKCRACAGAGETQDRRCASCSRMLAKGAFSATQLAKPANERKCHTCAEQATGAGERQDWRCAGCDRQLEKGAFSATQLAKPASERKCHTCAERAAAAGERQDWRCAGCDRQLGKGAFSATQLAKPASVRKCRACAERASKGDGRCVCALCGVETAAVAFSRKQRREPASLRKCRACCGEPAEETPVADVLQETAEPTATRRGPEDAGTSSSFGGSSVQARAPLAAELQAERCDPEAASAGGADALPAAESEADRFDGILCAGCGMQRALCEFARAELAKPTKRRQCMQCKPDVQAVREVQTAGGYGAGASACVQAVLDGRLKPGRREARGAKREGAAGLVLGGLREPSWGAWIWSEAWRSVKFKAWEESQVVLNDREACARPRRAAGNAPASKQNAQGTLGGSTLRERSAIQISICQEKFAPNATSPHTPERRLSKVTDG
ncbi:unnamed protein product [Effrenium voratum]|uniref:ATP-dependent DNA helicase n=1 Tax=Effrenium voratum TaxID=2562239 RepID=A0AA36HRS3_9DINO|nr:unnamed protein product [Effrenium voratum]